MPIHPLEHHCGLHVPTGLTSCYAAGPSAEARQKSLAKRRRKAGLDVYGEAAKKVRRAQLRDRGFDEEQVEERVRGVGLAGEPFFRGEGLPGPLGALPARFSLHVAHKEDQLRALARTH